MGRKSGKGMDEFKTERTAIVRRPKRGFHDFETISRILDEGLYCVIGFCIDSQPYAIPTSYGRDGRTLYFHGSSVGRMSKSLCQGIPLCVTVTRMDGLVVSRRTFHHGMNYRSVMIFGQAEKVEESGEKLRGLEAIFEQVLPGRWADLPPPAELELKATAVMKLRITEASAKIREGQPMDDKEDYELPHWAGVIPFAELPQPPLPDPRNLPGVEMPDYIADYRHPGSAKKS